MKFTIDRKSFADALKAAAAIIPARSPKPILTCVHISSDHAGITVRATDLELELVQYVGLLESEKHGVAVVPAVILAQIVGASTDSVIAIEHDEKDGMTITSSDGSFKLFGYPAADYPTMSANNDAHSYAVQAGPLAEAIGQTLYATATDNSRYAIAGVMIDQAGRNIELIATDGHRLALSRIETYGAKTAQLKSSTIVPKRALSQFARLFSDPAGMVNVTIEAGRIVFADDNISLSSSLVEGNFPPHKDVIPKNQPIAITIDREAFASAVKRAAMLTNEESKGIKLSIADQSITITSRAPESGEAEIIVPKVSHEGGTIDIGFNPFYLLDVLKSTRAENIELKLTAANKPGTITAPGMLAVVMPVNLT